MQYTVISNPQGIGDQYDALMAELSSQEQAQVEDLSQPMVSERPILVEARILRTRLESYASEERW